MSRTRTSGTQNWTALTYQAYRRDGAPSGSPGSFGAGFTSGTIKTTTDEVIPDFHKRKARGDIFNNAFSSVTDTRAHIPGPWNQVHVSTSGNAGDIVKYAYQGLPVSEDLTGWPASDFAYVLSDASTRVYEKLNQAEVQGLVFLAELRKTIAMLRNPLANLHTIVDGLSSRDLRRVADGAASQHLMWMFGVKPLLSDINAAVKVLRTLTRPKRFTVRATSKGLREETVDSPWSWDIFTGYSRLYRKAEHEYRTYVLYETLPGYGDAADRFGLRLVDVPGAMWELIPYSFVVDWLVNVGDYIAAMTPKVGVKILAEGYTHHVSETLTRCVYITGDNNSLWNADSSSGDGRSRVRLEKYRVPGPLGNYIGLSFNPKVNFNTVTESISLLTQKLTRR